MTELSPKALDSSFSHKPANVASPAPDASQPIRPWLIWTFSFGVWGLVALAGTCESYEWWRTLGQPMTFATTLGLQLSQILSYALLTPPVFALAKRFPINKKHWLRRSLLHLLFAVIFTLAHITLRGVSPFAAWDNKHGRYVSGIWNSHAHVFEVKWKIFENLFLSNIVEDITGAYIPIVIVEHALSYYWRLQDRELHSAKLEMQLTNSRLQALKSHLQPHFLFNTMHSISALMLTDVQAADQMMVRLCDLLRMSLETGGAQLIRLRRELEFVAGYLEIEKIRLGERLNISLNIAGDTLDAQVPCLLLQPLVENAIRHGISRLVSGGTIWITSRRSGNDLCLEIADNGPGLSAQVSTGTGLGLRATRERLETFYGGAQIFDIRQRLGGGAEVHVKIPFRTEPEPSQPGLPRKELTISSAEGFSAR